ncbi:hypothetical protein HPY42_02000 [Coprothermobacteraceae bacterium]|nr:hypothetical protein [Coprothermobacteraceae bacterium]
MNRVLSTVPGVLLSLYFVAIIVYTSLVYGELSSKVVPLRERLSDVFPRLLPWVSLFRFKVRADIVSPYVDTHNDFVYLPERMLMHSNVWNVTQVTRTVGEALQIRSSLWVHFYRLRPVFRWIFLAGFFAALFASNRSGFYFFGLMGALFDFVSFVLSTDAINRGRLVLAFYSAEAAAQVRLLPPDFVIGALTEPYRILRLAIYRVRWGA